MALVKGEDVFVQSFKHDGSMHRVWSKAIILKEDDDLIVAVTDQSWVVEHDGRKWLTKEPALCFFYKKRWFNIISMIRRNGIYYYCNLASPSLYDGEAIKNIDYDLDIKVYPDGQYHILDVNEYNYHCKKMAYPKWIDMKLKQELKALEKMIKEEAIPFKGDYIKGYLQEYFALIWNEETKVI